MAVKLEKFSTRDSLVSEMLFKINCGKNTNRVKSFLFRMLTQDAFLSCLRFIVRYLIKYRKPEDAQKLLVKYLTVVSYNWFIKYNFITEELRVDKLEEMFKNELSIEALEEELDGESPFVDLYKSNLKNYKQAMDKINLEVKKSNDYTKKSKHINNILFTFYNAFSFFSVKTDFTQYLDSRKSCDIITAEAIASRITREFDFEILDNDEFMKNIVVNKMDDDGNELPYDASFNQKKLPQRIRNSELIIATLINDSLVNDLDIDKTPSISPSELKCYTIDGDAAYSAKGVEKLTFIRFLRYKNERYYVDLSRVNEFKFKYNDREYLFSKNGIISI